MMEALDDEPLFRVVMGACRDIVLRTFPCLGDGLICELLNGKNMARNALEHFSQVDTASLLE
jgi:hypothetical protein